MSQAEPATHRPRHTAQGHRSLKRLLLFLPALVIAGLTTLPGVHLRPSAPAYRTARVERGTITTTAAAAGTLNAVVLVDVGSQISGQIGELYADFNSAVQQGQVIARIAPEIYEAKVAQAEADLEAAQTLVPVQRAQIERSRAELENAQALQVAEVARTLRAGLALNDARQEFDRKRQLFERTVVSASEWERAQSAYSAAQEQVSAARAQASAQAAAVRAAEAALRMAEAQLANTLAQVKQRAAALREAQIDLDHTYIHAPVTGTVVNRNVNRGQTVAASLQAPTLFTIAQDLTRMQVEAAVVEADVSRFTLGQTANFSVDAYPGRSFTGRVVQIRKAPKVEQNVVTYVVVISANNPDGALLPGMTANLRVVVAERRNALRVHNTALRFRPADLPPEDVRPAAEGAPPRDTGSTPPSAPGRVFVVGTDGQPTPVPVRLGASDGHLTEVLEGALVEGEAVIVGAPPPETPAEHGLLPAGFRLW
jgi:HlyD family secretion protein